MVYSTKSVAPDLVGELDLGEETVNIQFLRIIYQFITQIKQWIWDKYQISDYLLLPKYYGSMTEKQSLGKTPLSTILSDKITPKLSFPNRSNHSCAKPIKLFPNPPTSHPSGPNKQERCGTQNTQSMMLSSKSHLLPSTEAVLPSGQCIPMLKFKSISGKESGRPVLKASTDRENDSLRKQHKNPVVKRLSAKDQVKHLLSEQMQCQSENRQNPQMTSSRSIKRCQVKILVSSKYGRSQMVDQRKERSKVDVKADSTDPNAVEVLLSQPNLPAFALKSTKSQYKISPSTQLQLSMSDPTNGNSHSQKHPISLFEVLGQSRRKSKIVQKPLDVVLAFRTGKMQEGPEEEKYSYSKIYDQEIVSQQTRSKKNSKVQLWQVEF